VVSEGDYQKLKAELEIAQGWNGEMDFGGGYRELQGLKEKHKELCEEN
jgi:hypothetical protein